MSDDPMAAALARLRAEHPDLPTDGGRVWEPVQDEGEAEEAPTPLELAEQPAGFKFRGTAEIRSAALVEAADFLRDAHFRDGLNVQEIGTALRHMADEAQQPKEAESPRTVCVCGHTRAEHLVVGGRLLCDECDPESTENLVCKEFEAL